MSVVDALDSFDALHDSCSEAVRDVYIYHKNNSRVVGGSGGSGEGSRTREPAQLRGAVADAGVAVAIRDGYASRSCREPRRSKSFSGSVGDSLRASQFSVPGGFRRQFLLKNNKPGGKPGAANASASHPPHSNSADVYAAAYETSAKSSSAASSSSHPPKNHGIINDPTSHCATIGQPLPSPQTRPFSFLATFLRAYEDSRLLHDVAAMTDEDFAMLSPDVASHSRSSSLLLPRHVADTIDAMPLLDLPRSDGDHGKTNRPFADKSILAGTSRTVFNIIKSFLGTAILFIPRGIRSAGLVAGAATLMCMAGLSTWAMVLLLRTRRHLETSGTAAGGRGRVIFGYGHVARLTLGRGGQYAVETAILLSQLGFCCVYFSFWGQMLSEVCLEFSGGAGALPAWVSSRLALGAICLALSVPLVWIRHLKYLAVGNFLSDIAIAFSLGYIVWAASAALGSGHAEKDWSCAAGGGEGGGAGSGSLSLSPSSSPSTGSLPTACFWINPSSFLMFAGTAVYSFEGIAMVLPIQSSMQRPQDMVRLLSLSMLGMSLLLASFGAFCFYVFGQNTANIVISNLPQGQPLTRATQIAYLFVAVITVPMCLFPAIRIWERWAFTKQRRSGKKWQKNFLRTAAAVGCLFVGVYGGAQLDHLVSLIGGMFSTPLALVFPPLLHLKSQADPGPCARVLDLALILFGVVAGVLATWVALSSW